MTTVAYEFEREKFHGNKFEGITGKNGAIKNKRFFKEYRK
jgi:hypothetical protein